LFFFLDDAKAIPQAIILLEGKCRSFILLKTTKKKLFFIESL